MAHVPALPGCAAIGRDREEALAAIRQAVADYLAWLHSHGEPPDPQVETVEVEMAEEVPVPRAFSGTTTQLALFQADLPPLSVDDLRTAMRRMEYARQDLLSAVDEICPEALDWHPMDDAPSVADILLHVAQVEAWLLSCLDSQPTSHPLLTAVRNWAYQRLSRIGPEERARTTEHHGTKWTARKVLRHFLEHERDHTAQIRKILEQYRRQHPEG
jgi:predicted RNase H-like HicB family nuclease/uncharacterized damage-inducible protein DinB